MSQLLRPPTTDEQVARALASHYGEHPNLKNDDAFAWCLGNGFPELSERGFYERVLPEARRIAELPQKITSLITAFAAPSLGESQRNSWRLFSYAELFLLSS